MSDFDKAALLVLCDQLERADSFQVVVNLDGKGYRSVPLADLPAKLAVWWVLHYVKSRLVPFEITPAPDLVPDGAAE